MVAVRRRWFLPERPDLVGLLREQARVTATGVAAFASWSEHGRPEDAAAVRATEHEGDRARRALVEALRDVLDAPLDQEDLYTVSERLDDVLNTAKNTVRLAQELSWSPDEHAAAMGSAVRTATGHLVEAIDRLGDDADGAAAAANRATKASRAIEHHYRLAVAHPVAPGVDPRALLGALEVHRRYAALGEAVARVAHRVWYSVLKEG